MLTDFILGSRLKQFLDAARIPQHNHYIVCGLSGIGIKIIQQLHLSGHEVVAIETDANDKYVTTARGMSILSSLLMPVFALLYRQVISTPLPQS